MTLQTYFWGIFGAGLVTLYLQRCHSRKLGLALFVVLAVAGTMHPLFPEAVHTVWRSLWFWK